MNVIEALNSGTLHAKARAARPDCVDAKGNIHHNADRARFVGWLTCMKGIYGTDVATWPTKVRSEYDTRYVPSH